MKHFSALVAVVILIQVSGILSYRPTCYANEMWYSSSGVGPACRNSCTNRCVNTELCIDKCESRCFCKPGWKYDGIKCILQDECSKMCNKKHEIYHRDTGKKEGCTNSCSNNCLEQLCTDDCEVGCFCQKGYRRNSLTGECIEKKQCPKCEFLNFQYSL